MSVVIFDMDGTLVDSEELALRSAEDGLAEYFARKGIPPRIPRREDLRVLVGLPSLEYFAGLLPEEFRVDAALLRAHVVHHEIRRLREGEGRLFPGVREMLATLRKEGFTLALVSNCGRAYLDGNLEHQGLRNFLDLAYCLDDGPSKTANVAGVLSRTGRRSGYMVGDRLSDIEAGRANGLTTVGCAFGFGTPEEIATADHLIGSPLDLLRVVRPSGSSAG
jgi:phosphoglycolate phosphatase-like HAD superfamily hydrolase